MISDGRSIIDVARAYADNGWAPIPIPARSKAPTIPGWQQLRLTAADVPQHFRAGQNVGVLLGEPSGWLIDVDLDHSLAVELADEFLPATECEFGRPGKPRSHRLYRVYDATPTHKRQTSPHGMLVELRSTGAQTVFPGSIHECGEPIEWVSNGEPASVSGEELTGAVNALADEIERRLGIEKKPKPATRPQPAGRQPKGPDRRAERARAYVAKMDPAISGCGGHAQTFEVACTLYRFGLAEADAAALLDEYNTRCEPPWSEKELAHKLGSARARVEADGEFGCKLDADEVADHFDHRAGGARKFLPEVLLPGGSTTITEAAKRLGELLDDTGEFYLRGGMVMRLENDPGDGFKLAPVRPAAFCSDLERVAKLLRAKPTKEGPEIVAANCTEATARLILESAAFRAMLPGIKVLAKCPVLIERRGELIQVAGYDRESGIMAKGSAVPIVGVDEASARLDELVADFDFATPGDRTRALAAIITPALVLGGLLRGRAPIDLGEADNSQAGKGYRNKITAAVYGVTVKAITQQPNGGVGSLKESFDAAVVDGNSLICLDNLRGKLDLPAIESFATEDTYRARVPYSPGIEIDPRRVVLLMTSNRAEMTIDLANRSSVVRIRKRGDGYQFARYPEGDILDRVTANPGRYLSAVFSVVQEWHRRGRPEAIVTGHDFRPWARTLGYIVGSILGCGQLLDGHRAIQERIASPGLNWLRDLAIAVQRDDSLGKRLRSHDILRICVDHDIETAGVPDEAALEDESAWLSATRTVGRKMAKLFKGDKTTIDAFVIERHTGTDDQWRQVTEYAFFPRPLNTPQ